MMIIDGSERIIWSMWIMLSWIRSWGLNKNQPEYLRNFQAKILISTSHFSSQFPAHPSHNVLYVQMMIADGSERIIWSMWIMLSWICSWGFNKNQPSYLLLLNYSKPKSSSAPAISPTNVLLIHPIMS
jgi:hypothetical protein